MARGTQTRAPSQNAYRGSVGQTQTETVHVTSARGDLIAATVYTTVDAVSDPELVERLHSDSLNTLHVDGSEALSVAVPLVYHDPAAEVFALVLGEAQRHRELDERIRLLERLRSDRASVPVYVKDFAVVFGGAGLRSYLEGRANQVLSARETSKDAKDHDRKRADLAAREAELQRGLQQLAQRYAELERSRNEHERGTAEQQQMRLELERDKAELERDKAELERDKAELERDKAELERDKAELERSKLDLERMRAEARARVIAAVVQEPTTISPVPTPPGERDDIVTKPIGRQDIDDIENALDSALPSKPRAGSTGRAPSAAMPFASQPAVAPVSDSSGAFAVETVTGFAAENTTAFSGDGANAFATEAITRFDAEALREDPPLPEASPNGSNGSYGRNGANGRNGTHASSFDDSEQTGDDGKLPVLPGHGVEVDDEPTGSSGVPAGADPLTTQTHDVAIKKGDKWVDAAAKVQSSTFAAKDGVVRLALVAGEQLARGLTGNLDLRVLLHRLPTYPVVVIVIGPPAALRAPSPAQLVVIPLDAGADGDRAVLTCLAKQLEITADIVVRGKVTRRVRLVAPLAENVGYILRAADDHLRGITADGETDPSYAYARDLVLGAGFDLLGLEHAEASEFRDDKLAKLDTAQHVRRAIAIARRFVRPSREDYLVCARSYPLTRWRELRKQVLERAVTWGLWMGPELAQVAVSEGLARSRRDLVIKLDAGFEALRRDTVAFDLDSDAADDNAKAIAEDAKALGVELRSRKSSGAIKSEDVAMVSGSIERTPTAGVPVVRSIDELVALLDDKNLRVAAASELCDRADARAAGPVIHAVKKLSRAEAVRILGKSVKFGGAAVAPLIEGLSSSKAFLRHGCALALALLRTDEGTHAVIEQLLAEPTEIWREIARALGQVGPAALMPLASHVGRLGDRMTPTIQERVAWAMAHVGVRGGKAALEQMAAGQSVMAPVARQALALHGNAAQDEVRVRPGATNKDVTVNRAFSRRFFEALEADRPEDAQAALHDLDASGPLEVLDGDDLLVEDDEDEAELDESDLIQP